MNTPDWHAIETRRDADRYSAMCAATDAADALDYLDRQAVTNVCAAIRSARLSRTGVRQILETLGSAMAACGEFSEVEVASIDDTGNDF